MTDEQRNNFIVKLVAFSYPDLDPDSPDADEQARLAEAIKMCEQLNAMSNEQLHDVQNRMLIEMARKYAPFKMIGTIPA